MERDRALLAAKAVWEALKPVCRKVVIAGSLRRGAADVNDAEIVCLPHFDEEKTLFEETIASTHASGLAAVLDSLLASGRLCWDETLRRRGEWYKRFRLPQAEGLPLDLFLTREENWGNILALRTGPAEFSKALVTPMRKGGLLPNELKEEDGLLWRVQRMSRDTRLWKPLECPTEEAFFRHLRLPCLPPAERTEMAICRLRRLAEQGGVKS